MRNLREFFDFCLERESIRAKKNAGLPKPWTTDPVLQTQFFCNIYREDDKVTTWFRENIRDVVKDSPTRSLIACVAFRWFNSIASGELIKHLLTNRWDGEEAFRILDKERKAGKSIFNGAYIISSPLGDPKLEWAIRCIDRTITNIDDILAATGSQEQLWRRLCDEQGLGPFMSYEIVTDLRWTCILWDAPDINKWANPGPGCARGLGWLIYNYNKGLFTRSSSDIKSMICHMREILECSNEEPFCKRWEMREVEHSLCEYDKWKRGHDGQKLKRRYPGIA